MNRVGEMRQTISMKTVNKTFSVHKLDTRRPFGRRDIRPCPGWPITIRPRSLGSPLQTQARPWSLRCAAPREVISAQVCREGRGGGVRAPALQVRVRGPGRLQQGRLCQVRVAKRGWSRHRELQGEIFKHKHVQTVVIKLNLSRWIFLTAASRLWPTLLTLCTATGRRWATRGSRYTLPSLRAATPESSTRGSRPSPRSPALSI